MHSRYSVAVILENICDQLANVELVIDDQNVGSTCYHN